MKTKFQINPIMLLLTFSFFACSKEGPIIIKDPISTPLKLELSYPQKASLDEVVTIKATLLDGDPKAYVIKWFISPDTKPQMQDEYMMESNTISPGGISSVSFQFHGKKYSPRGPLPVKSYYVQICVIDMGTAINLLADEIISIPLN